MLYILQLVSVPFWSAIVPTLVENSYSVYFFIMTGEPMHIASNARNGTQFYCLKCFKYLLHFIFSSSHSSMNQQLFEITSAIKVPTIKWLPSWMEAIPTIQHLLLWVQRWKKTLVSPWRMHCTYSSMAKGTSRAEKMSRT